MHGAPKIVGLIPLSSNIDTSEVLKSCLGEATSSSTQQYCGNVVYANYEKLRSRFSFVPTSQDLFEVLDVARVADIVIFVTDRRDVNESEDLINQDGLHILEAVKALGCPTMICAMAGYSEITNNAKKLRSVTRYIESVLEEGVKVVDSLDGVHLIRHLSTIAVKDIHWRANRSYLLADNVVVNQEEGSDAGVCKVQLNGYLRGRPMNLHSLCHIVGAGTGRVDRIKLSPPGAGPLESLSKQIRFGVATSSPDGIQLGDNVLVADREKQDSLVLEAANDGVAGEQTWPTEAELAGDNINGEEGRARRQLPKKV